MSQQSNMQKDVLVLNMEQQLEELADEMFGKKLEELEDRESLFLPAGVYEEADERF